MLIVVLLLRTIYNALDQSEKERLWKAINILDSNSKWADILDSLQYGINNNILNKDAL